MSDGTTRLVHVPDGELQLDPQRWFRGAPRDIPTDALDDDGMLVAGIGALLVEHGGARMLIDAGVGPIDRYGDPGGLTGRWRGGDLLTNLTALGVDPATIDLIALTHLHLDHVGWLLGPRGLSAFARARVVVSRIEWRARWSRVDGDISRVSLDALESRVDCFDDGEIVWGLVRAHVAAGHTSGHTTFEIPFGEGSVIVLGDAMHSPVQVTHPSWPVTADEDAWAACEVRLSLRDRLAQPTITGYAVHFADVVFGTVAYSGGVAEWAPVDAPIVGGA